MDRHPCWGAAYVWSTPSTVESAFQTSVAGGVVVVGCAGNSCSWSSREVVGYLRGDHDPSQKRCEVILRVMVCCQRKSKGSDWSILFLCTTIETASHAYGDSKQHYLDRVGLQQTLVSDPMTCPRFWSRRSTIKEGGGPQQESWKPWIYNTYMTKYDCMIWKRKILFH